MKEFSLSKATFWHLLPAFCFTIGVLVLDYLIPTSTMPRFLIFVIGGIFILAPVEMGIIKFYKRNENSTEFIDLHRGQEKIEWKQTAVFSVISIFWAIMIFGVLGAPVNAFLKETFFSWFPNAFNIGDYIENPQLYSKTMIKTAYFSGLLVVGIILPIVEELYFRGFLLPRMNNGKYATPLIETILFAVYHLWSPWMIPIRILAIFPMVYFVSQKRNIYIAIVTHIFLNVVGDFILIIPLIFD